MTQNHLKLRCKNCERVWDCKSSNPYYVSCPRCKGSVNVKKSIVRDSVSAGGETV